jgi:hypothetical protein
MSKMDFTRVISLIISLLFVNLFFKLKSNDFKTMKSTTNVFGEVEFMISADVKKSFALLDLDGSNTVKSSFLIELMTSSGILPDDIRLDGFYEYLERIDAVKTDVSLGINEFARAIDPCITLFTRVLSGTLRVPDFASFCKVF